MKGLFIKARQVEIKEFGGISGLFEPPLRPELEVDTGNLPLEVYVAQVMTSLSSRDLLIKAA